MVAPIEHEALSAMHGIRHGFFTREGGVSEGIYAGLNSGLGSSDKREHVIENRQRITRHLGGRHLLTVHQVHSAVCVRTAAAWRPETAPRADAIVTCEPGLVLCAQAADCGPILFADRKAGVVGAAHAGWKGAMNGIVEATIEAMEAEGAARGAIVAVLGPSISAGNYEVGPEFKARFVQQDAANERYFTPSSRPTGPNGNGHAMFDLQRYTLDRLRRTGVRTHTVGRCTYAEPSLFFSYRRATHRGEPDYGRLASAIMLTR